MLESDVIAQLPPGDWEATPPSVREIVLRLAPLAAETLLRRSVARHQELFDRMFVSGLSGAEREEMRRLAAEIDEANGPIYDQALESARDYAKPPPASDAAA
jgi:hypothetical protein